MKYTIAIAGSTNHTVICAKTILQDSDFQVAWILTPSPKLIGRKQVLTKNPLHLFAEEHDLPCLEVSDKIDGAVEDAVLAQPKPSDFLLVVDFGYLVPEWLLKYPRIAPLNIHPSDLPRWRGSSPGQFVLLHGEKQSAVTLMVMGSGLDTGPIIKKEFFDVDPSWTQTEYYSYSFELIQKNLAEDLKKFASGELVASPQPELSPTPPARRLTREDGFISWGTLEAAMMGQVRTLQTSSLLLEAFAKVQSCPLLINQAVKALQPWPGVWTKVMMENGEKRMKILETEVAEELDSTRFLKLKIVQLEGEAPSDWQRISSLVK